MEEEWDRHCLTHLESITSKRCASITYYNILFRPTFCPFCLGDDQLPASSRWNSWTREAKLWSHLGAHLATMYWPRKCHHPYCSLELESETLFLYHLNNIHSLHMSASLQKSWPSKRDREDLTWASGAMSQKGKRKRQGGVEQGLQLSDKRLKPIAFDEEDRKPPRQLLNPKATEAIQTSTPPEVSKVAFMDLTTDNDILPELTHEVSSLSPKSDETHSLDGFSQHENTLLTSLLPGPELDQDKVQMLADNALFSEFLRSPSPSLSQTGADYSKDDLQTSIPPQTIVPADICLSTEKTPIWQVWLLNVSRTSNIRIFRRRRSLV